MDLLLYEGLINNVGYFGLPHVHILQRIFDDCFIYLVKTNNFIIFVFVIH